MTIKEILIELKTDINWLKESQRNHLDHHRKMSIAFGTAAISAILILLGYLLAG